MTFDSTMTVGEVALEMSNATRVFETVGIDYCCGGAKSLADACASAGVATEEIINRLNEASRQEARDGAPQSLRDAPLTKVIAYIVDKHHVFTRQELARLDALFVKVCSVHGRNHTELQRVQELFKALPAILGLEKESSGVCSPDATQLQETSTKTYFRSPDAVLEP